ncbi:hypothetical protein Vretifemale_4085, partial [Volvox reticuliferus]
MSDAWNGAPDDDDRQPPPPPPPQQPPTLPATSEVSSGNDFSHQPTSSISLNAQNLRALLEGPLEPGPLWTDEETEVAPRRPPAVDHRSQGQLSRSQPASRGLLPPPDEAADDGLSLHQRDKQGGPHDLQRRLLEAARGVEKRRAPTPRSDDR